MYLDIIQLSDIFGGSPNFFEQWEEPLNDTMKKYQINTEARMVEFVAQVGHESNRFNSVEENLNYSADGLMKTFGKYFPTSIGAMTYARQPQRIANRVYANRNGNGDEASGDGWMYRGRGLIQVTGRDNYKACGIELGIDCVNYPDYLKDTKYACMSAGWYWNSRNLNSLADFGNTVAITQRVNGGQNGIEDRLHLVQLIKKAMRS